MTTNEKMVEALLVDLRKRGAWAEAKTPEHLRLQAEIRDAWVLLADRVCADARASEMAELSQALTDNAELAQALADSRAQRDIIVKANFAADATIAAQKETITTMTRRADDLLAEIKMLSAKLVEKTPAGTAANAADSLARIAKSLEHFETELLDGDSRYGTASRVADSLVNLAEIARNRT